ncbi:MAG: hypothetical protein RLY93_09665 [Sumerlaeia bacterium]
MQTRLAQVARLWRPQGLGRLGNVALALLIIVFVLQPTSAWLRGYVDWNVINPASNHTGWYVASLKFWLVSWIWPAAYLLTSALSGDRIRASVILVALTVLAAGKPKPFYQGSLTDAERWLLALESWYQARFLDAIIAAMAVATFRWPALLMVAIPIAAIRIFL